MARNIDLHIHSNLSDGVLSPKEIIDTAKKNNVETIAIADHDTLEAYTNENIKYAKDNGIALIPAVEISTKMNKVGVHILAYNIDIDNPELLKVLSKLKNSRKKYLDDVSKKLNEVGYMVNYNELDKIEIVTKAHISRDVISNDENKNQLLKDFGYIPNMGDFIETILNENCKAYVEKESITPKEAATIIRKAGGKVVLAHPVAYKYEDDLSTAQVIKIIEEIEADAIESNYIYIDKNNIVIDDCDKWNEIANKLGISKTIGSDYHKTDNIHPEIGFINYPDIYNNIDIIQF